MDGTIRAASSITATQISAAVFSGSGLNLTNLQAESLIGNLTDARLSNNVALRSGDNTFTGKITADSFAGNGSLLTGLNAANLTGSIDDARLSGNVALRAGGNSFSGNQNITDGKLGISTASPTRMVQMGGQADTEGMIRLSSRSASTSANRTWDIGVPKGRPG